MYLWLALLLATPAPMLDDIREIGAATTTTNVTVTTTTETVAIASGAVLTPGPTSRVIVFAWVQLTTGAATTTVTPRIQRTAAVTGAVVGDAIALEIMATAGDNETYTMLVSEERSNTSTVEYNLSVQQADATGNGTVLQAGIIVFVL
jgi:hypothetical protein